MRASAQATAQTILVKIVQLPQGLQNNSSPQTLSGIVTGQNPDGSVKLQTDQGIISLMMRDKTRLPEGMKLDFEIPAGRNPQQATIRTAESAGTIQQPQTMPTAQTSPSPTQTNLIGALNAQGMKLDRTNNLSTTDLQDLILATKPDQKMGVKPTSLNAGDMLRLTSVSTPSTASPTLFNNESDMIGAMLTMISNMPDSVALQKLFQAIQSLPFWDSPDAEGSQGKLLQTQLQTLSSKLGFPPQTIPTINTQPTSIESPVLPRTIDLKIISILPTQLPSQLSSQGQPQTPITVSTPQLSTPVMVAQFDSNESGLPMMRLFPNNAVPQNFAVPIPINNIPHGQIMMVQPTISLEDLQSITPLTIRAWLSSGQWESLDTLLQNLQTINPALGTQIISQLPNAQSITNNNPLALLFLAMLKGDQIDNWIPTQILSVLREQNKINLLRPLQNDQAILNRLETAQLPQDWRINVFPFWHDGQTHKLPLYFKSWDEEQAKNDEKKRKKMRFLFDLNLSRMGLLQVDGFFQSSEKTPQLDIILRAQKALSSPMQQTMKALYTKSLERSNLHGELSFQFRPDQWVNCDEILENAVL